MADVIGTYVVQITFNPCGYGVDFEFFLSSSLVV